ncbi:MAG: putative Pre-mRNA-splicing factor CEF1 [Streblomastix strix]|uniref:Putative Pre-mRNA-splicing factor CEF1 n=1 Tax=Streblomastix strix TaxID=222440 RepID=A0A5J4VE80_9EUKA|nr:MAG: putative Pre-mRNA-splicing factor CEF1 [Streblomastix strix]
MKIPFKGGIWKNSEDEVLKAAVMKYGKNQWARISSLLVRKTAKQCKARWYEWLDPSIKKTEWTREEEEKLLHLAKLMPCQWRTIAQIVRRPPAMCMEHHDRLLDQALGKGDITDPSEDPRRLRPGEIDPNPEGKPARPDTVDMDDDEKEMISEAIARLANTKGKKAKRRARERQLEEARRLASLQRRRELKAAGIDVPFFMRYKHRRGIDLVNEIPFLTNPPKGSFEVKGEIIKGNDKEFLNELAFKEERERAKKKQDKERQDQDEEKEKKKLAEENLPEMLRRANKKQEQLRQGRKKVDFSNIPQPQIGEQEMEQIVKTGLEAQMNVAEEVEGGSQATKTLLPSAEAASVIMTGINTGIGKGINMTPSIRAGQGGFAGGLLTPMRQSNAQQVTQRITTQSSSNDFLMKEARDIIALRDTTTPLIGGTNAPLHHSTSGDTIIPKNTVPATPNELYSALRQVQGGITPRGLKHNQQKQIIIKEGDTQIEEMNQQEGNEEEEEEQMMLPPQRSMKQIIKDEKEKDKEELGQLFSLLPQAKQSYTNQGSRIQIDSDEEQEEDQPSIEDVDIRKEQLNEEQDEQDGLISGSGSGRRIRRVGIILDQEKERRNELNKVQLIQQEQGQEQEQQRQQSSLIRRRRIGSGDDEGEEEIDEEILEKRREKKRQENEDANTSSALKKKLPRPSAVRDIRLWRSVYEESELKLIEQQTLEKKKNNEGIDEIGNNKQKLDEESDDEENKTVKENGKKKKKKKKQNKKKKKNQQIDDEEEDSLLKDQDTNGDVNKDIKFNDNINVSDQSYIGTEYFIQAVEEILDESCLLMLHDLKHNPNIGSQTKKKKSNKKNKQKQDNEQQEDGDGEEEAEILQQSERPIMPSWLLNEADQLIQEEINKQSSFADLDDIEKEYSCSIMLNQIALLKQQLADLKKRSKTLEKQIYTKPIDTNLVLNDDSSRITSMKDLEIKKRDLEDNIKHFNNVELPKKRIAVEMYRNFAQQENAEAIPLRLQQSAQELGVQREKESILQKRHNDLERKIKFVRKILDKK